jgi:hypothetical protein
MDTDCGAVATCVPLDPALGQLGVVLPDPQTPCPPNYTTATTINRGQVQSQCSGCSCTPPATSCLAPIGDYPSYDACTNNPNAPTMVSTYSSSFACMVPGWNDFNQPVPGSVYGISVGQMTPSYAGCTAGGTAMASTPTWTTTNRFCAATMRGGGCGTGSACLPAITNNPPRCAMAPGSAVCPSGTTRTEWYTGLTGNFACNPCSCTQPSGASCANVRVAIGDNSACDAGSRIATLASGEHICAPNGFFKPSVVLTGTPTAPTCTPQYTTSGALTPSGAQTVCCR